MKFGLWVFRTPLDDDLAFHRAIAADDLSVARNHPLSLRSILLP